MGRKTKILVLWGEKTKILVYKDSEKTTKGENLTLEERYDKGRDQLKF